MNVDRIRKLAETVGELSFATGDEWEAHFIGKHRYFNMLRAAFWKVEGDCYEEDIEEEKSVEQPCNSPACIAGWAVQLFSDNPALILASSSSTILSEATHLLDISGLHAEELFMPDNEDAAYNEEWEEDDKFISPERAARVLNHFADTGVVDWTFR